MLKKKKKGKKFWAIVGIFVILPIIAISMQRVSAQRTADIPFVETAVIERGSVSSNIYTSGIIRAKNSSISLADISGRIVAVNFENGDEVSEGDTVASMDKNDLIYAVKEAELNLDLIKKRELSEFASAERAYNEARDAYERKSLLYEEGALSKAEFETAERLFLDLKDDFERIEIVSSKQIELETLRLQKLRSDLEKTQIVAPFSGTLTDLQIEAGSFVTLNQPLFKIQDFSELEVLTKISEYDISRLEIGQDVLVKGQGGDEAFEGKVSKIAPDAVISSNGQGSETVVEVVVEIIEETKAFKPNFSAELQILTGSLDEALLVPYEAVYIKKNGDRVVYLLTDENKLEEIEIKTGMEGDLLMELITLDGSKPENRRVVLAPTENLKDGMAVRANDAEEGRKQ